MPIKRFGPYTMYTRHLLFLVALAASVHSTAQHNATEKPDLARQALKVSDSQRRVSDLAHFYWVDDRRVLLEGINGEQIIRPDGYAVPLQSLFLWDTETGEVANKGEIGGGLCYAEGYVRFRQWKAERRGTELGDIVAGALNGEISPQPNLAAVRVDPRTCRPWIESSPLPDWTAGKSVRRLSEQDGFFLLGPEKENRNTPVTYHPKGEFQGVLMPFKRREARFGSVEYFPFKGAYFVQGDYFVPAAQHPEGGYNKSPWPPGVPIPVWWLYPDGRVAEMKLASDARDASWLFPAKNGFYFVSHRYPTRDGLYRVIDLTKVVRILKGSITKYAVSPSGCAIAVNHDGDYHGTRGKGTLKSINVCSPGD